MTTHDDNHLGHCNTIGRTRVYTKNSAATTLPRDLKLWLRENTAMPCASIFRAARNAAKLNSSRALRDSDCVDRHTQQAEPEYTQEP